MKVYVFITLLVSLALTYTIWDFYRIKAQNTANVNNHQKPSNEYVLNANDIRRRNDSNKMVIYDYYQKFKANYLIVDLSNPKDVCFKSHLSIKTESDEKIEYKLASIDQLMQQDKAFLEGHKPIAAFNTSYFSKDKAKPLDFNFIQGRDYTWFRDWTSMNITAENQVTFIREKVGNLYNTAGGGPKIITNGVYSDPCITGALTGNLCTEVKTVTDKPELYNLQRTMVGITSKNKMIVLVSAFLQHQDLDKAFNEISEKENAGKVLEANLFDGGSSSALVFDDDFDGNYKQSEIKQSGSAIVAVMLVYTGEACKYR